MTVSDLIRELQAMPPNAEVRIAMDTVVVLDELAGDYEVKIAQVEEAPPIDILRFRGWTGKQTENRYSHWIWRQYASAFWDDVRIGRVLPFREARDSEDEKHVHPLQLDVIDRILVLWSNPGETVLTPFMGIGSEVYGAVVAGRRGIGIELKASYYRQALKNMRVASQGKVHATQELFEMETDNAEPPTLAA